MRDKFAPLVIYRTFDVQCRPVRVVCVVDIEYFFSFAFTYVKLVCARAHTSRHGAAQGLRIARRGNRSRASNCTRGNRTVRDRSSKRKMSPFLIRPAGINGSLGSSSFESRIDFNYLRSNHRHLSICATTRPKSSTLFKSGSLSRARVEVESIR